MKFSFPRQDVVQTGTPGYAFVFDTPSGETYIYLKEIGSGSQSRVNLVANTDTGELMAQKVNGEWPLPYNPLMDPSYLANLPEDRELRILEYLNTFIRSPASPMPPLTPRWVTCVSHNNKVPLVSYWKLCNGGIIEYYGKPTSNRGQRDKFYFPISLLARCIAQVSETLHVMYHAGPEAVYHCDLHSSNVFLHFGPRCKGPLPDFYMGDFGLSHTATESLLDTKLEHTTDLSQECILPDTAPLGQRRRWDMEEFLRCLEQEYIVDNAIATELAEADRLQGLLYMLKLLDDEDRDLAAYDPHSRPPCLLEVIRVARGLETAALAVEQHTEQFKASMAWGRARANRTLAAEKPFVFHADTWGWVPGAGRASAEKHGADSPGGNCRVIESV